MTLTNRRCWITVSLLTLGLYSQAFAADNTLGEIWVQAPLLDSAKSATLSPIPLFSLPLSASKLTASDFTDRQPKDIADLADYSPGVSRSSNYWGVNTPTFQLRGFNAGDATAYYKDGFRYQGRGPLSMANIENVEILRGPQSAIYGWSEPGGVVQLHVKQPTSKTIRTVSLQTDAWGKTAATLDLGGALNDSDSFRFVGAREQGSSFRDRQFGEQTLLAPSFARDFSGGRKLTVTLEWLDDKRSTDYGIPAINGTPANVPVSRIYTESWGKQHSQSTRLATRWVQPAWGGDLAVALSYYNFKYLQYLDTEPYAVTGTTVKRWYESYPEQYRWLTAYADWSRGFETGKLSHRFAMRFEVARETRALKRGVWDIYTPIDAYNPVYGQAWTPTANYSVYDQSWTNQSLGLALQDEVISGNWTWLLGARLNYLRQVFDAVDYLPVPWQAHNIQTDNSVTPRIGVSWRTTPDISLYANYSAGNMATLPQRRSFTGSPFAPMTGKQFEAGVKMQPVGADWLASAALFDIELSNLLTPDLNQPGFSIQMGTQRSRGLELEWQGKVAHGWHLTAQGTWLDASITRDNLYAPGNRLPYAPRFGASAWLSHNLAFDGSGRWSVSGGLVHQGERYADFANTTRIPAYTRLDLGASYKEKLWSATLALENAANVRYYSSGVENRPAVIYPGAPRTLSLKLNYDLR